MNIKKFDLNLLLVFRTVFEEKNVTKASKKLGITQPAMSNALNRLRYLVKDELFIRGPQRNEANSKGYGSFSYQ